MGYEYSKIKVHNDTAKCWKVTLKFCHEKDVHGHDGQKYTRSKDKNVQPHSNCCFDDIHRPYEIFVEFASNGSSKPKMRCNLLKDFPEGNAHVFRIRPLDRKSAELHQEDAEHRGKRDQCGHPDVEGDLQEQETRRKKQLEREKELEKQIQIEQEQKRQKLAEANRESESRLESDLTSRKQFVLQEVIKYSSNPSVVDEENSASAIYDKILALQPAYRTFDQLESLHKYSVVDRCGYLFYFILSDYCQAHNLPSEICIEVLSVTRFDDLGLRERLTILDALSKSVHAFDMFDDLEDLKESVGSHAVDAILEFFLRLICVTMHTNVNVAAYAFLHCLEKLPSRYRGYSTKFSQKERETLFLLISNRIWTPSSAFLLLYDIEVEHRADTLQKSLFYHVECKSVKEGTSVSEEQVSLQSPSCNSEEVQTLLRLIIKKAEEDNKNVTKFSNYLSFDQFAECIVSCIAALPKRTQDPLPFTGRNRESQLRLLIECLVCETPSTDWQKSKDHDLNSAVVAVIAAIQARLGHAVDIVVSNETYALWDIERWREFFECMGVSSCTVDQTNQYCHEEQIDIVYGTPFQIEYMEGIPRPGGKFTCLILCDGGHETDIPSGEVSNLLPRYKFYYNLTKCAKVFREDNGIKSIKKVIERTIEKEEDKPFRQVLQEIEATNSMLSVEMHRRLEEIIHEYTLLERNGDDETGDESIKQEDLRCTTSIARAVSSIAKHVKKHTNFYPRKNQLVAVITLLLEQNQVSRRNMEVKGGWFLEVSTGEGKSTIVAMFAAIQALRGKYVDVVTSSDVLARRDEEEWREFYRDLGLSSCAVPNLEVLSCESQRDADDLLRRKYQSNIVYGTVSEFAADILRHEFEQRNSRGNRRSDVVIVDEVDSMTLDNGMQLTYLSHDTTSLRHIEQLLAMIWCLLSSSLPIEESHTGDILWASKPKYIHTAIAESMVEDDDQLAEKSCDILTVGCSSPLNLFNHEDCEMIRQLASDGESIQQLRMTQTVMKSITPDDEVALIKSQNMADVSFQLFKVDANNKATPCSTQDSFDNVSDGKGNRVMLLLSEKGIVRELFKENDLKQVAVDSICEKITYSDGSVGVRNTDGSKMIESERVTNVPNEVKSLDIVLPIYLKEYVDHCLPIFIDNALNALSMTMGREYCIVDGRETPSKDPDQDHSFDKIVPVDFEGTGMLEKNKKWSDGLQQFLEMKHQLAISPVSTVTNFLSNYRFFQRYSEGIHGVTGTLGDSTDHRFLQNHFSTMCVSIPPHRIKKLVHHPMVQIRAKERESWIAAVCKRTEEIAKEQTVLVVCEDLKTAESFKKKLESSKNVNVHMYTRSDIHKCEMHEFNRGEVIITTTLGGRGTDYKVHRNVNSNGGLFVILTFFPDNLRVEKQMIGRTARKGNPGMFQFILHDRSLPQAYQGNGLKSMHALRLRDVEKKIQRLEVTELDIVNRREDLFGAFCRKLKVLDQYYKCTEKDPCNLKQTAYQTKFDYVSGLSSVKERWAFWLTLNRSKIEDNKENLQEDMERVIQTKIDETQRGESNNCYDHARNATRRMALLGKDVNHVANDDFGTFQLWQRLAVTEKIYNAVAFYNQAYITIKTKKGGGMYREKALDLLDKTLTAIEAYIAEMATVTYAVQIASSSGNTKSHLGDKEGQTNFNKQQTARGSFMNAWHDSIKSAVKILQSEENTDSCEFIVEPVGLNFAVDVSHVAMEEEMTLLADMGVTYFFKVEKEKKFKFCWDALVCCLLGVSQVIAGVLVISLTCGAGSSIGLGLICEGITDIISGVYGMVEGTFSWAEYAISKAISIVTSLCAFGISALTRAAKTARLGAKATAKGLKGAGKMLTDGATNKAIWANSKLAGRYVVKEFGKKAVIKGVSITWNKGLTSILETLFKNYIRRKIGNKLDKSSTLCHTLEAVIAQYLTEQSSELDKEQLRKTIENICQYTVHKSLNSFETYENVWTQIDQIRDIAIEIAKKEGKRKRNIAIAAFEVPFYTSKVCELAKTAYAYWKNTVASDLSAEITRALDLTNSSNRSLESQTEKDVYSILCNAICDIVTDLFTHKIVHCVVSMSERHGCQYVASKLGSIAANILDEVDITAQFAAQDHIWAMKVDSGDAKKTENKDLTDKDQETPDVNKLADEVADVSKEANDLHLNVLTKTGLTDGRNVVVHMVDKDGKSITSVAYEGGSDKKPIIIYLVQTKNKARSFLEVVSGEASSYSGHFEARDEHGNALTIKTSGSNCLFDAIGYVIGKDAEKLRKATGDEIREDPCRWKALLERQRHFEATNRNSSLFSVKGGGKKQSVKTNNPDILRRIIEAYLKEAADAGLKTTDGEESSHNGDLGNVDEYKVLQEKEKGVPENEQDHIPGKGVTGKSDSELAMTVLKIHHKAALSSYNGPDAHWAREHLKKLLNSDKPGDSDMVRHLAYALAYPETSNMIRRLAGYPEKTIGTDASSDYYFKGFLQHSAITQAQAFIDSKELKGKKDVKLAVEVNQATLKSDVTFINLLKSRDENQIKNHEGIKKLVEFMSTNKNTKYKGNKR